MRLAVTLHEHEIKTKVYMCCSFWHKLIIKRDVLGDFN